MRVSDDVVCVFNSTPLEKYESYRLCLSRWSQEGEQQADIGPTIYNLIDSLLRFLDVDRYSSHNGTQPKFLVDLLPEVHCGSSDARLRRLLSRVTDEAERVEAMLQKVESRGTVYLPAINAFYVREFQMTCAAEEASRFLHHACRGLPLRRNGHPDRHWRAHGSLLCPDARTRVGVLWLTRVVSRPACYQRSRGMRIFPRGLRKTHARCLRGDRDKFDSMAQKLGYTLGSQLYDAYLRGCVSRSVLRHLLPRANRRAGQGAKNLLGSRAEGSCQP